MVTNIKKKIMHLALTTQGSSSWALKNNKTLGAAFSEKMLKLLQLIDFQVKKKIPLVTVYLFSGKIREYEEYDEIMTLLGEFFELLKLSKKIHENKIKISVLGKWYDIEGNVVEAIKHVIDQTKDYDNYFLNLCINYDGQEEIVDACKIIARKIKFDKMSLEQISKETIKENIYSSYFLPPDIILINGDIKSTKGFLLWDSVDARIVFTGKFWQDITMKDLEKYV